jgi:hypothetical protein
MSNFNADEFMQQTVDGPLETEFKLPPEGEYQNVYTTDFDSKAFELIEFKYKQDGPNRRAGDPGEMLKFNIPFKISNEPRLLAELGRDETTVSKQLIVDRDTDGKISRGPNKNVELGRIYEAAGINSGNPSPADLRSKGPFVITIVHEKGKRPDGSEWKQARVGKVTRQS